MVTIADIILQDAMNKLKSHIVDMVKFIYLDTNHNQQPNWGNGEEYVVLFSDLAEGAVGYNVVFNVFDEEGKETFPEVFTLWSIHATLDGYLYFWDKDNEEHDFGELSVNDLVKIANLINVKYAEIENEYLPF